MPTPNADDPLRTTDHALAPVPETGPETVTLQPKQDPSGDGSSATPSEPPSIPSYEIEEELGRGGMGVVYKARHLALKRTVALKMVLAGGHAGPVELARFRIEAEAVARLQHPNIVQIHEVGEADGHPYLALEFVEGGNLASKIDGKPLPARESARLVETLARAMQLAHSRNVVHRDLKPANILLAGEPAALAAGFGTPKITDFGLARQTDSDSGETQAGAVMGTPSYMAPEQASGRAHEAGPAADVYALGAILYACLTGRPPFKGSTVVETLDQVRNQEPVPPSRWQKSVPLDLETICLTCLRKEPEKRYASAAELADDLGRYQHGEPIRARAVGRVERAVKWVRRRPGLAAMSAALVLVTLLGVAGILWKYFESEERRTAAEQAEGKAEEKRIAAEGAEQFARGETKRANKETAEKARELRRAEGMVYVGNLLHAELLWQAENSLAAREQLDACRWDYRGWEFAHLRHRFDETMATFRGHSDLITTVAFAPDGKRLASASQDRTVKVWNAVTGQELLNLKVEDFVRELSFSPDGKRLAGASLDKTVKVWDTASGQLLLTLRGHTGPVLSVCFSPDGQRLASASGEDYSKGNRDNDGAVKIWDANTGRNLFTLPEVSGEVWSVCYRPDGKRLASGIEDKIKVWDATTGKPLRTIKADIGLVYSVCYSPDGKSLAGSALTDGTLRVWNAETGQERFAVREPADAVKKITFSPDGRILAGASGLGQTVKGWDTNTGRKVLTLRGGGARQVSFSPEGKRLAGIDGSAVKVWDLGMDQQVLTIPCKGAPLSLDFAPDSKRLVGANGLQVKVWDADSGEELLAVSGKTGAARFSPDGKCIVGPTVDNKAVIWEATTGQVLRSITGTEGVSLVSFSPDGKQFVGADQRQIKVWDAETGQVLRVLDGHGERMPVWKALFSPDGKRIASVASNHSGRLPEVKVWDAATGQNLFTLKGHALSINTVCFSPDSQRLATASYDRTVKVWDAATGQEVLTIKGHRVPVLCVCFSPDGKRIATASGEGTSRAPGEVKVWDAVTGEDLFTFDGHTDMVSSVCFSPDGARIASTSRDGKVRIWKAAAGQDRLVLKGLADRIAGLDFSADGTQIVAQSVKKEVRSWDAETGQEVTPCTDLAPPEGKLGAVSSDGKLRISAEGPTVRVIRTSDSRPSSDLVFLARLNDLPARQRWHRAEAADSEAKQQWFAAAFHLRQLLAVKGGDTEELQDRLKRCEENLNQP